MTDESSTKFYDAVNESRRGSFLIARLLLMEMPDLIAEIQSGVLLYGAEWVDYGNAIRYFGYCPAFPPVDESQEDPRYSVLCHHDEAGPTTWEFVTESGDPLEPGNVLVH